jgi:hypothetical protein
MSRLSRADARVLLANIIAGACTGSVAVYSYQPADIKGQSPVIYITTSGSNRANFTGQGVRAFYYINVHILVVYSAKNWTPENAENTLDELDREIESAIMKNQDTANWYGIDYESRSNADNPAIIGGVTYLHEVIPLVMEVK